MAATETGGARLGRILDREGELAEIDEALAAAPAGAGRCLVLAGPGGIGKTRLLAEAQRRAQAKGLAVLAARAAVLEGGYAFGIVRQLLDPPARQDRLRGLMLAGAGDAARRVLDTAGSDMAAPDVSFAALHGLFWAVANLAADTPLLICVDDVHWIDGPSLRFVDFLARRLDGLRTTMLLAWRSGEVGESRAAEVLSELEAAGLADVIELGPLSQAAVLELTHAHFADRAEPAFSEACHARTGGNPFFLVELLRELRAVGVAPTAGSVERVASAAPRSVSRVVLARLGRLGSGATAVAQALSVLGGRAPLADAATLAGLADDDAANAAGALVAAGVLRDEGELEFVHPLIRDAIEADTPAAARAEAHRKAARVLAAHGRDRDQVAAQLMASAPRSDSWTVERLHAAARDSMARGAPDVAAVLLRRALNEPPPAETAAQVLADLGVAEAELNDAEAVGRLEEAIARLPAGAERARVALVLARRQWLAFDLDGVYATVAAGRAGLTPPDRELALLLDAVEFSARSHDPREGAIPDERLTELAGLSGTTPGERAALAMAAFEMVKTCRATGEVLALVERAVPGLERGTSDTNALVVLIGVLHWSGEIARAIELATAGIDHARSIGSAMLFAEMSAARALAHWRGGRLLEALADANDALHAAGSPEGQMYGLATHALIGALTDRGESAQAEDVARRFFSDRGRSHNAMWPVVSCSYGALEAQLGRPEAALDRLVTAGRMIEATGCVHPAAGEWRQPAARILAAGGSRDEARELLAPALEAAGRSQGPYEWGISLHAAAMIEEPVDIDGLRRARDVLEASELRLHHARVLVDLGAAVRRAGHRREAREPLSAGMELAHRCGSTPLAEHARTELLAAGARPRKPMRTGADALTPSEWRVAGLARDGLSNREIAQQLFVSPRTVEAQLRSVYAKLGISTRAGLAELDPAERKLSTPP